MRLLEEDNMASKIRNFNERFLLNYNELDLQTSEVTKSYLILSGVSL